MQAFHQIAQKNGTNFLLLDDSSLFVNLVMILILQAKREGASGH